MDEESAKLIATIAAMKLLLGQLYKFVYTIAKLEADDVLTIHKALRKQLSAIPLGKSSDPAISDVLSDETAHEIDQFLQGVERSLEAASKRQ
jgi:hypothetical protein